MSHAHDAAIAFLIAQHVQESAQAFREQESTVVKVTMNPEPRKSAKPRKGEQAAPIHGKSTTPGITMPERNTLDAKGFLQAMRDAGKRPNDKGIMVVHPSEVRNDQIKAIHAYCGYDNRENFGAQDQAARAKAQRELRGPQKVVEVAKPSLSAGGYVAGMPDHKARKLADLQGREVAAVDAMLAHQKDADNPHRSPADRELSAGLAEVERERLTQIRADIAALL
jgi:hypothetical protein